MWTWTPDKKVGDEVSIHVGGSWNGMWEPRKIVGETATQWLLPGGYRIRKKDGKILGRSFEHAHDMSDEMRKHIAEVGRERRIDCEAQKIINRVRNMWSEDGGREWLVKHIGPLLPKKGE